MDSAVDAPPFATLLRRHRLARGWTQDQLAERARISARGLSDLERGLKRAPRATTVRLLIEALDLGESEAATLLAAAEPPRWSTTGGPGTNNLPRGLTSFIAREQELGSVRRLLEDHALVTLVGPGGVGKTRLAIEAARMAAPNYPDGVRLVELSSVRDGQLVAGTIAEAVGVAEQPGRALTLLLREALCSRRLLLILDNCEHLIETCSELVHALLGSSIHLRILATSREPLQISGEHCFQVAPLELPPNGLNQHGRSPDEQALDSVEAVRKSPAVRLFVERAQASVSNFALDATNALAVSRLCAKLDGLPLALELAAAQISVLSPSEMVERLDRSGFLVSSKRMLESRQQTLRATLDWSYVLLTESERRLLAKLSVFARGFTRQAAEWVGSDASIASVVQGLARLIDKSLVVAEPNGQSSTRYRLLETVRQFAFERLAEEPATESHTRGQHAAFFLALADEIEPMLWTGNAERGAALLDRESNNLRVALRELVDQRDAERAQRLAGTLARYWIVRSALSEGITWLTEALALPRTTPRVRMRALVGLAALATYQANFAVATKPASEALALARELRDHQTIAWATYQFGGERLWGPDPQSARPYFSEGLQNATVAGNHVLELMHLFGLALASLLTGDSGEAAELATRGMAISLELGDARETARAQTMMGLVRYQQQRLAAAQRWLERALLGWRALADPTFVPQITLMLTWLALDRGDGRLARHHVQAGLTLPPELTTPRVALAFLEACAELANAQGNTERAGRLRATVQILSQQYGPPFELLARLRAHSLRRSAGSAVDSTTRVLDDEGILSLRDAIAFALADGEGPTQAGLSARERQVVQLVAEGSTNREIADQLCISERTIERHLSNIFDKLEVRSRSHLTRWAANNSLLLA